MYTVVHWFEYCTSFDTLIKACTFFDTCIYHEPSQKISIYKPSPSLYPMSSGFSCPDTMLWRERNHYEWHVALPCIEHACPCVAYVKTSNDITSSCVAGNIREFTIHQRDGDKNAKKQIISKTTTMLMHHTFLYSSLPFLHNYALAMPNFACYGERKQTLTKFIFLFLNLDMVLKNSAPVGFTFNWQRKWVGIIW